MSTGHSVSEWVRGLAEGDRGAAVQLWRRYYPRLVGFARRRAQTPSVVCDEEDLASQTMQSFLERAERGRFASITNRQALWCLLRTIVMRKAANARRDAYRRKRDPRATAAVAVDSIGVAERRGGSAEDTACLRERFDRVLGGLDGELRAILDDRIRGYTNVEIAARARRSVPTIERRLRLIRERCREEGIDCLFE
ncbi:MAG: sigma-70 family RNA polymerase sigma factor [Planctomycetes bacterium]|nr:sigma-70 family RNA polymerase sigma factor [Planctomycetota bacterium]